MSAPLCTERTRVNYYRCTVTSMHQKDLPHPRAGLELVTSKGGVYRCTVAQHDYNVVLALEETERACTGNTFAPNKPQRDDGFESMNSLHHVDCAMRPAPHDNAMRHAKRTRMQRAIMRELGAGLCLARGYGQQLSDPSDACMLDAAKASSHCLDRERGNEEPLDTILQASPRIFVPATVIETSLCHIRMVSRWIRGYA